MTATVKINTSDLPWIRRHGRDPVPYGTDLTGRCYFTTTVEVDAVERVTFAGAKMIRFDIGPDAPRDHDRWAMYPAHYLVAGGDEGIIPGEMCYCGGKIRGYVCRECGEIYPGARVYVHTPGLPPALHTVATFDGEYYIMRCNDSAGWDREHVSTAIPAMDSFATCNACQVASAKEGAGHAV